MKADELRYEERRSFTRVSYRVPGRLLTGSGCSTPFISEHLSLGGVDGQLVSTEGAIARAGGLEAGDSVQVRLGSDATSNRIDALARVVHGGCGRIGLQFVELELCDFSNVRHVIEHNSGNGQLMKSELCSYLTQSEQKGSGK